MKNCVFFAKFSLLWSRIPKVRFDSIYGRWKTSRKIQAAFLVNLYGKLNIHFTSCLPILVVSLRLLWELTMKFVKSKIFRSKILQSVPKILHLGILPKVTLTNVGKIFSKMYWNLFLIIFFLWYHTPIRIWMINTCIHHCRRREKNCFQTSQNRFRDQLLN